MTTRRLLIVSPHFPPVNTPDMQRVRMLLPFFRPNGWRVEVLAVEAERVTPAPLDQWLADGLPEGCGVRVGIGLGILLHSWVG